MIEIINISGTEYTVIEIDEAAKVLDDGAYRAAWGSINYFERKIRVYENQSESDKFATLIHEVVHGCAMAAAIDLSEEQVTVFSNILSDTLKRNDFVSENMIMCKKANTTSVDCNSSENEHTT